MPEESKEFSSPADIAATRVKLLRRGLAKMKVVMTPEFFRANPVLRPFFSKLPKSVEIKRSSVAPDAGLGLFAKKNIKAYTVVSFYPAHALGIDDDGNASFPFVTLDDEPEDVTYFAQHSSFQSPYLHCTDQPIFQRPSLLLVDGDDDTDDAAVNSNSSSPDLPSVFLDVNPDRKPVVEGWVSQFINDGATVTSRNDAGVLEYYQQSAAAKNCIHIPLGPSPIMATMTTKKVKQGQELLTTYGATYWLGPERWPSSSSGDNDSSDVAVENEAVVALTPEIQSEIQATARDLLVCLQNAQTQYAPHIAALQAAVDAIVLPE